MEEWINGEFGQRVKKDKQNKHGWIEKPEVDILNSNKTTILCFSGNGTTSSRPANFLAKFVQSILDPNENSESFNFFSAFYGSDGKEFSTGKLLEEQEANLYNTFFKPLLVDENGKVFEKEKMKENFLKLKIFSYCYGSFVTSVLLEDAAEFLKTQKFNTKDIREILDNVFIVEFAPCNTPRFGTQVQFISFKDSMVGQKFKKEMFGEGKVPFLGTAKANLQDNVLRVVSNSFTLDNSKLNDHSIEWFLRERELEIKKVVGYTRLETITDAISTALCYGALKKEYDLKELQMALNEVFKMQDEVVFEKKQKEIFEKQNNIKENLKEF